MPSSTTFLLRTPFRRVASLTALVAIGAMVAFPMTAGAADDNGGASAVAPESIFGAAPAAVPSDINIALFFDPTYVDTSTGGSGEAYNLQQTLLDQGFNVTTFTGVTTAEWTAALAGACGCRARARGRRRARRRPGSPRGSP